MALLEAHIGQQPHLDYILDPIFHSLWFKHGTPTNASDVLGLANIMKVSQDIKYISEEQFFIDLSYLYGALKQSLKFQGSDLINKENQTKDGIAVLFKLYQRYKYGGDKESYKAKQLVIMNIPLTKTFSGGPLAYLERWEKASIIYDNLSKNKVGMDDDTKRSFFIQMFHLTGVTETTLDLAVQSTNTFEELCYSIRQKLAKKEHVEKNDTDLHANQASVGIQQNIEEEINARANYISNIQMASSYINTIRSGEWNIGAKLWAELSTETRKMITELRNNGRARQLPSPN